MPEKRFQNTNTETSVQEAGRMITKYFKKCILSGLKRRLVDYESGNSVKGRLYLTTAYYLQEFNTTEKGL